MLWLDFLTFGHGHGLSQPYFDGRFYWLVDTSRGREDGRGALYTFMHGFGAQLVSRQWFHPRPDEERTLIGRKFRPFNSSRRWLRVEVSWATPLPKNIDEANAAIRELEADLHNTLMDPWRPKNHKAALAAPAEERRVAGEEHPDDIAVDRFAVAMKAKLAKKRADGRGGWDDRDDCSNAFLSCLLREHIEKGDPVDVGNLAMMIHQRGERIG
jgi:hypothetical protein